MLTSISDFGHRAASVFINVVFPHLIAGEWMKRRGLILEGVVSVGEQCPQANTPLLEDLVSKT